MRLRSRTGRRAASQAPWRRRDRVNAKAQAGAPRQAEENPRGALGARRTRFPGRTVAVPSGCGTRHPRASTRPLVRRAACPRSVPVRNSRRFRGRSPSAWSRASSCASPGRSRTGRRGHPARRAGCCRLHIPVDEAGRMSRIESTARPVRRYEASPRVRPCPRIPGAGASSSPTHSAWRETGRRPRLRHRRWE